MTKPRHLQTETLLAILNGHGGTLDDLQHLHTCPQCQSAFDDSRWIALLRQLPTLIEDEKEHLDPDVVLAYRAHALAPARHAQVGRHLRGCDACLSRFERMRVAEQRAQYESPSPAALTRAMAAFRPGEREGLGTVLVRRLGDALQMVWQPETRVAPDMMMAEPTMVGEPALGRGKRPPGPEPVAIPLAEGRLLVSQDSTGGLERLELRIDSPRAALGGKVRIRSEDGHVSVRTDAEGKASIPLRAGRARLVIELDPPVTLDLDVP